MEEDVENYFGGGRIWWIFLSWFIKNFILCVKERFGWLNLIIKRGLCCVVILCYEKKKVGVDKFLVVG